MGALPMEEALALLYKDAGRAEGDEDPVARDLCSLLGRLPLALALAGAYLAENPEVPLMAYRDRLRREGALAVDAAELEGDLPTRHDKAVEATLRVSWEGGGEAERLVMTAAALLGEAAEVPKARLALLTGLRDRAQQGYPAPLGQALRRLVALSLVEELGEQDIRLHPLVREFAERQIQGREGFARECAARLGEALWDLPRLDEAVRERGVDAVLGDLRFGAVLGGEEAARWLGRLARVLDREAHCLRRWDPTAAPGFLLQQVRNRCFELEEDEGCARAEQALGDLGKGWLRERVRTSRESEALDRSLEGHTGLVFAVGVTPDGRQAVSAARNETLEVWDLGTGQVVRTLEGRTGPVTSVAVTPDGLHAVSASMDKTLEVWDLGTGKLVHTLEGHASYVTGVAVTRDGRQAVSASWDGTLKVWDVGTGQLVRTLEGHTSFVNSVAVTADGLHAVSASWDKTLKVWDLGSGELVHTLEGHTDGVIGVAVTPEGRHAVSASDEGSLGVWDIGSGQLVFMLEGHMPGVNSVAVTPDGLHVISASIDAIFAVRDLATGRPLATMETHAPLRCCVAASNRTFLAGDEAGGLHILDWLPDGHLLSASTAKVSGCVTRP